MKKYLLATSILGIILTPSLKASEWDKKTVVKLPEPMAVPGTVLPQGEYVIKRADESLPNVVQFSNMDETEVLATVHAIPTQRQRATDNVVIVTEERPAGEPEAIKKWFYPGELTGAEFVYGKGELMAQASQPGKFEEHTRTLPSAAAPKDDTGDSALKSSEKEAPAATLPREPVKSEPQARATADDEAPLESERDRAEERVEIAQATPPATPAPGTVRREPAASTSAAAPAPASQGELPRTATGLTLASMLGSLAVLGGAALRKLSRRLG
jgi:hypothetical protein